MSAAVFQHEVPIAFGDVDYARVLYYPRLFHYCHLVMERFYVEVVGVPYPTLIEERRLGFPTVHLEADYRRTMDYRLVRLRFAMTVARLGTSSVELRFRVFGPDDEAPRAEARVTTVCVDMDRFASVTLPPDLREVYSRYLERGPTPD